MEKKISAFAEAYKNRREILENPEQYSETITNFLAGGLGCCAYSQSVSVAELVRCWQHKEYQVECPRCGTVAYVYKWVGHVGPGGYWTVRVYCSDCMTEYSSINILKYSWGEMRKIYNEVVGELNASSLQSDNNSRPLQHTELVEVSVVEGKSDEMFNNVASTALRQAQGASKLTNKSM